MQFRSCQTKDHFLCSGNLWYTCGDIDKIIIIIEGVDKFIDLESGKEANIAFWLPEKFPKNIKVLCSVSEGSEALTHFQKIGCEIVTLDFSNSIISSIYD
jgi:hypothetical protein